MQLVRLGPSFQDYADTAAAMACLDLVISVDSSPAHMAGAIGCPVWLLLNKPGDLRWRIGHPPGPDRTVWYSCMRIFQQHEPGLWGSVIERVRVELARLVADRGCG